MGNAKYRETGIVQTYPQALEKLIIEKIIPFFKPDPWQGFRDEQLWTIDVNDILEANLENLRKIYNLTFTSVKKYITFQDIIQLFTRDADVGLGEVDLLYAFGMSKMAVTNEVQNYKQYSVMQMPEFLEFIGRMSDVKFRSIPSMASNPLAWKIDQVLDEIMPQFGLTKNDVNVVAEENSESDDDY